MAQGEFQRGVGRRNAALSRDVVDPSHHRAGVPFSRQARILNGLGVGLDRYAAHDRRVRRHGELGVPDVLVREARDDLVGEQVDVLRIAQQVDHREIDVDEVREVGERVERAQRLQVRGDGGIGVASGEAGHSFRSRGADVMDVQLDLGQVGNEGLLLRWCRHDAQCLSRASAPASPHARPTVPANVPGARSTNGRAAPG